MQSEEVGEHWTLGVEDLAWLSGMPDAGKLGLAVQLMCWRRNGRFPDDEADPAPAGVRHLADQIGVGGSFSTALWSPVSTSGPKRGCGLGFPTSCCASRRLRRSKA